ncbi:GyrI-like domain-containing protein [uncultured Microbacterium sp.]|uniref:AraC family transcriptional regulator n=1 Tax=uncultured Microbacterium sp. TaxID=191216 RepID=UPI0026000ACB|nr:GyrI-like domain-containing protein [uncultured Microbacterium sp.]
MRAEQYQRQLDDVTAYIYAHLDDDLDLSILAEVARFSPYHWHRVYRAVRGETAAQTVQRLRLERAAAMLVETSLPVGRIARRAGFGRAETFGRALVRAYGLTPSALRSSGSLPEAAATTTETTAHAGVAAVDVEIRELAPAVLAVAPHHGDYLAIGKAFAHVRDRMPAPSGVPRSTDPRLGVAVPGDLVAVYRDDPGATPAAALRSWAGVVLAADAELPEGLERRTIPGGRHAVLRYVGPYSAMHRAYRSLYGAWLPASGHAPRDEPVFEIYRTDPATTRPTAAVTEIVLPVA